jgi:hypothetical protein
LLIFSYFSYCGVTQIENRANSGMPSTLDDYEALFRALPMVGFPNSRAELLHVSMQDILLGKASGHGHRTHVVERTAVLKHSLHQGGVLVDPVLSDQLDLLADRFDIADLEVDIADRLEQTKRSGGFSIVLPGRGPVDAQRTSHTSKGLIVFLPRSRRRGFSP